MKNDPDSCDLDTVHGRLKWARLQAGFRTAKQFAETIGVPQPTYANHEKGGRGVTRAAKVYAEKLGVALGWLLTGEGQASVTPERRSASPPATSSVEFDAEDFVAAVKGGMELSGVKLSRAEEMKLLGHALELFERIKAGADPAQLLAELVKPDNAAAGQAASRR